MSAFTRPRHPGRFLSFLLALATLTAVLQPSVSPAQTPLVSLFEATLLSANEVPSIQTGSTGSVVATLDGDLLRVIGSFSGLGSAYTASHIHAGAIGENGPPVFNLSPRLREDGTSGFFNQNIQLTEAQATDLRNGSWYVNVHSAEHPGGEIRGQLFSGETRTFLAAPMGGETSQAFGRVFGALTGTELRVTGFFASLSGPFANASLHVSPDEWSGPVAGLNANPDQNNLAGTFLAQRNILRLTDALVDHLITGSVWVNIYVSGKAGSDARGRLQPAPAGMELYEANLSGFNEVPAVNSVAAGRVTVVLGPAFLGLERLQVIGYVDHLETAFMAAGIYSGAVGETGELVRPLQETPGFWPDNRYGQVIRMLDQELSPAQAEAVRAGAWYIGISSSSYPDGELRGQILPGESQPLRAHLTGSAEIPPVTTAAFGEAVAILRGSELRFVGAFDGLSGEFTSAQLHVGREDEATIPFMSLQADLYEESHSGVLLPSASNSATFLDAQAEALRTGLLYLNVYSTAYASGEIRGHFKRGTGTPVEDPSVVPRQLALSGNFPNPFNPSTNLVFDLPVAADISVEVFDLMGRRVLSLMPGFLPAGADRHVNIDAGELSSGIYLYRVTARKGSETRTASGRMTLLK